MSNKSFSFTSHGERKNVRENSGVLIYINVCITIKWIKWVLQVFSHISAINYGASQPKTFNCLFYQLFVLFCLFFKLGSTNSYKTHWKTEKTHGYCKIGHNFHHYKHCIPIWIARTCRDPGCASEAVWPLWVLTAVQALPRETTPEMKHWPWQSQMEFYIHGLFLAYILMAWHYYCDSISFKWQEVIIKLM